MTPVESLDPKLLDDAEKLPPANQRSYMALIAVQALNAFNDNFVKMLLVAFAGVIAKGTDLGSSMQLYLGAIFSLPYVLFAPISGWLSDRFSKQRVILWMQVFQVLIFSLFHAVLYLREEQLSLWLSLGCFFLLATQSAVFSPAKFGIMKELVGARRLGSTTGTLQLTNFMGILGGIGLAGWWFGSLIEGWSQAGRLMEDLKPVAEGVPLLSGWIGSGTGMVSASLGNEAWNAVNYLVGVATIIALLQILGSWMILVTPGRPQMKFYRGLWTEHFSHLSLLFSQRPLKLAALGISYFWLMSNAVGSILVTLSHEMHSSDGAAAAKAMSMMPAMLGVGVMIGSVLAGYVCRRRIELGLVPLSGYLLAATLLWSGVAPVNPWINFALVGVGIAGGAFMTPLYAYVQDRSRPEERARIMSAINLMDCVCGIAANLLLVKVMLVLGVPAPWQLLVLVPITLVAALYITKLLPRGFLYLVLSWVVKFFYRVEVLHGERMRKEGGTLILPNHVSYVDALVMGLASSREVRFVMLDTLYNIEAINWGLRVFGTVPISSTKPREAIRTVGDALKNQQAVVLFPEGQITRTGFVNELHKGFELMARLGGDAMVQPVWMDGLWGSMTSFEGGRFLKKKPKTFPYRVTVSFGELMSAKEATSTRVREALAAMSLECFSRRVAKFKPLRSVDRVAWLNALRVLDTTLLVGIKSMMVRLPREHAMAQTFGVALAEMKRIKVVWDEASVAVDDDMLVVTEAGATGVNGGRVLVLSEAGRLIPGTGSELAGVYDQRSGTLLTLSVPHPPMAVGEEDEQHGWIAGSYGHVLNGLSIKVEDEAMVIGGAGGDLQGSVKIEGVTLHDEGFLMPRERD
jgi:acyl-[acyl-carrier-protein]-phospholipid O-acyltransferase/long-chain-fatty-acid--[acyl-carrier-protein] ligase